MLPNWLGLGPGRAGTTTLFEILKTHPDIYLSPQKECSFFNFEGQLTELDLAWYEATYFNTYSGQLSIGEISPRYFPSFSAHLNVNKLLGNNTKFIITLRNPVDRALSHYRHEIKNLYEIRSFPDVMNLVPTTSGMRSSNIYIQHSLYSSNLARWLSLFPKENFLILYFEKDIAKNLKYTLKRICEHLEVDDCLEFDESTKINRNLELKIEATIDKRGFFSKKNVQPEELKIISEWEPWSKYIKYPSSLLLNVANIVKKNMEYKLTAQDKARFYEEHFSKDIATLEQMLDIDLSFWRS